MRFTLRTPSSPPPLRIASAGATLTFAISPSSLRLRAISGLRLEAGTPTCGWGARMALRPRASISAIGSLVIQYLLTANPLPTCLHDAGDLAVERQLTEAKKADPVLEQ